MATVAVGVVRTTFKEFRDSEGSAYYQVKGLTPEETWERVTEHLARVSVLTAIEGRRDVRLDVQDVADIHRAIFEPVMGPMVEPFRGKGDRVEYPIWTGPQSAPTHAQRAGSGHRQIRKNLGEALKRFERDLSDLQELNEAGSVTLHHAAEVAMRLYARAIAVHPFADGNGRTAWALLTYAMARVDLPLVALPPSLDTRWALGQGIEDRSSKGLAPLADIVVETIRASTA